MTRIWNIVTSAYGKYMPVCEESLREVALVNKFFQVITKQDHLCFLPVFPFPIFFQTQVKSRIYLEMDKFATRMPRGRLNITSSPKIGSSWASGQVGRTRSPNSFSFAFVFRTKKAWWGGMSMPVRRKMVMILIFACWTKWRCCFQLWQGTVSPHRENQKTRYLHYLSFLPSVMHACYRSRMSNLFVLRHVLIVVTFVALWGFKGFYDIVCYLTPFWVILFLLHVILLV